MDGQCNVYYANSECGRTLYSLHLDIWSHLDLRFRPCFISFVPHCFVQNLVLSQDIKTPIRSHPHKLQCLKISKSNPTNPSSKSMRTISAMIMMMMIYMALLLQLRTWETYVRMSVHRHRSLQVRLVLRHGESSSTCRKRLLMNQKT